MKTILIADDMQANREFVRELLEHMDYSVVEASDGGEVLRRLQEIRPDLLLLDIRMPVADGFAVLGAIRESAELRDLPVLAVSAHAMEGDAAKALEAGFDGYITKPVDRKALSAELHRLLG